MGRDDHYIFMDGCVVKGCRDVMDFEATFGDYAAVLKDLYQAGGWGRGQGRFGRLPGGAQRGFDAWAEDHVHLAQSTENKRTGAARVDDMLQHIPGSGNIHLFGTSAAGAAMLEYFLLTDPDTLYYSKRDRSGHLRPARRFALDARIASLTTIDSPTDWVPLRRDDGPIHLNYGRRALGQYLAARTRIQAGPGHPPSLHTTRTEDVPGTWVGGVPVADIDYDHDPHYDALPANRVERHIYSGGHCSHETRAFLLRVWR